MFCKGVIMSQRNFEIAAKVLKMLAITVGLILLIIGLLEVIFNLTPEGPRSERLQHEDFLQQHNARIFGLIAAILGLLYLIPNSQIIKNKKLSLIYLALTLMFSFYLIFFTINNANIFEGTERINFYLFMTSILVISLFSPLSFICTMIATKAKQP
jgi:hypothetical protein